MALDSNSDSAGVARMSRTVRGLRFLRLLRLGRVVRLGLEDESEDAGDTNRYRNEHRWEILGSIWTW